MSATALIMVIEDASHDFRRGRGVASFIMGQARPRTGPF